MESAEKIIEEIRQIKAQYKAEVNGGRKQWPRAIKSRIMNLCELGFRPRSIADQTGVSYHTISVWRAQQYRKGKFHQLPVFVESTNKMTRKKFASVTVTKKSNSLEANAKVVTVTVTTPEGFVLKTESVESAVQIVLHLKRVL